MTNEGAPDHSQRAEAVNAKARAFLATRGIHLDSSAQMPIRGNAQEIFAQRTPEKDQQLTEGVTFVAKPIDLDAGHFTNLYEVSVDERAIKKIQLLSKPRATFLGKYFSEETVAITNGGFFFLADRTHAHPQEDVFNLCVRDKSVVSLPICDRGALIKKSDGSIEALTIHARGTLHIGNAEMPWRGERSKDSSARAVVYGPASCHIYRDTNTPLPVKPRVVDVNRNKTPEDPEKADIVVRASKTGVLTVLAVHSGGGTDFFSGNFIVQLPLEEARGITPGMSVSALTLDDVALSTVQSAFSIGAALKDGATADLLTHGVNNDPSLGNQPFTDTRSARSIVFKAKGKIHFRVYDGLRESDTFKGLTPAETYALVLKDFPDGVDWGFHLDGSQSSRLVIRNTDTIEPYGNLHYTRWPLAQSLQKVGRYFLDPWRGRPTPSSIAIFR